MTPLTTLLTALAAMNSNKLRSGLTLLGIIIGVTAVIALTGIGRGAQESITARIEALGTNLLFVQPGATNVLGFVGLQGSGTSLTLEDSEALRDPVLAPSVVDVAPEITTFGQIVFERENVGTQIVGVTPSYLPVRAYELESGRPLTESDLARSAQVALLGASTAEDLFGLRHPVGHTIRINGRPFEVVGLLAERGGGGFGNLDDRVLVPIPRPTTAWAHSARPAARYPCSASACRLPTKRPATQPRRRSAASCASAIASPARTTSP